MIPKKILGELKYRFIKSNYENRKKSLNLHVIKNATKCDSALHKKKSKNICANIRHRLKRERVNAIESGWFLNFGYLLKTDTLLWQLV